MTNTSEINAGYQHNVIMHGVSMFGSYDKAFGLDSHWFDFKYRYMLLERHNVQSIKRKIIINWFFLCEIIKVRETKF